MSGEAPEYHGSSQGRPGSYPRPRGRGPIQEVRATGRRSGDGPQPPRLARGSGLPWPIMKPPIEKQPSCKSRHRCDRIPMFPCLRHAVEHGQLLPHAGGESQFLRLPGRQKPLVELSNDWVSACRHQSSHVQHSAHSGPSTPGVGRLPLWRPLSRLNGATPTRAACSVPLAVWDSHCLMRSMNLGAVQSMRTSLNGRSYKHRLGGNPAGSRLRWGTRGKSGRKAKTAGGSSSPGVKTTTRGSE